MLMLSVCPRRMNLLVLKVSAAWLAVEGPGRMEHMLPGDGGISMLAPFALAAIAWKADVSSVPLQPFDVGWPSQKAPLELSLIHI